MNWRLLTSEEKRRNRAARQQRKGQQKTLRRHLLALGAIHDPLLLLDETALPASKICESFGRKDLRPVKRAISEVTYLLAASGPVPSPKPKSARPYRAIPRPLRVLRLRKRGAVPSHFGPPLASPGEFLGAEMALEMAVEQLNKGADSSAVLQFLVAPEATGLDVRVCAQLVQRLGLLSGKEASSAAKLVEDHDAFHARLADGRTLFRTMVGSAAVEPARGDWISISRDGLLRLLPGVRLPREFRHEQFFANIIADRQGRPECLDIHATTFRGLCRHPLR